MESQKNKKLIELSPEDKKQIKADYELDPVTRYLANIGNMKFQVGDILNKVYRGYNPHGDYNWIKECVSDTCRVPAKYIYVYENEQGVGYVKRLRADGKGTTDRMFSLSSINLQWSRFVVDEDYAEHMLLAPDVEYDYAAAYKNSKSKHRRAAKHNKDSQFNVKNQSELIALLSDYKLGDEIYMAHNWSASTVHVYEIIGMVLTPPISLTVKRQTPYGPTDERLDEETLINSTKFSKSKPLKADDL